MAGAQADGGGVSAAAALSSEILGFARQLLLFAEQSHERLPERRAFSVPGASIEIAFSAPEYAALCDRAYLRPVSSASGLREATLAVLDYETLPQLPRWTRRAPGLADVTVALAGHGLRGAFDQDHTIWDIYDPARKLGVRLMQAVAQQPPWERSFPLRLLLHWAGRTAERGMIHAGTLGHHGQGVLLVGAGGSGKSGTTLSGIRNGLTSVGDDYISVRSANGFVEAQPLLRLMKQDIPGLRRLGLEAGKGALAEPANWHGKIEFDFEAIAPGARVDRLAMQAILMPHITGSRSSSFRLASAREAMLALAPSCLYQLYGSWREDFGLIASIVRALPAFHLDLSEDPAEIAAAIGAFIQDRAK
jgi:hypothetical protein